jgi:hypothetical protein
MVFDLAVPIRSGRALVGMGGEAADGVALCIGADVAAVGADPAGTIDQASPERAFGLVTHEDHVRLAPLQTMAQVMQDAPGVRHSAGDDDRAAFDAVDGHRVLCGFGEMQVGRFEGTELG